MSMSPSFARALNNSARGALVAVALGAWAPSGALALDSTGGTAAPVAVVSTRGTGGTLYAAGSLKPRTVKKPAKHTPARKPAKHKVKPAPAPPAAPAPSGVLSPAQTAALGA